MSNGDFFRTQHNPIQSWQFKKKIEEIWRKKIRNG